MTCKKKFGNPSSSTKKLPGRELEVEGKLVWLTPGSLLNATQKSIELDAKSDKALWLSPHHSFQITAAFFFFSTSEKFPFDYIVRQETSPSHAMAVNILIQIFKQDFDFILF